MHLLLFVLLSKSARLCDVYFECSNKREKRKNANDEKTKMQFTCSSRCTLYVLIVHVCSDCGLIYDCDCLIVIWIVERETVCGSERVSFENHTNLKSTY